MKNVIWIIACFLAFKANGQVLAVMKGQVSFQIKNAGIAVDGYFEKFSVEAVFNRNDLSKSRIEGRIEATSINTGIGGRDNHLRKPEYFDVSKHPQIQIRSKTLYKKAEGQYEGVFVLTIKGVSKEISIPFQAIESQGEVNFAASFSINRRDFGVGEKSWLMADTVNINVTFTGKYP